MIHDEEKQKQTFNETSVVVSMATLIAEAEAKEERERQERDEKRLQQRIFIAEHGFGSSQQKSFWQNSPEHDHDMDFFNDQIVDGKKNPYGKLKYKKFTKDKKDEDAELGIVKHKSSKKKSKKSKKKKKKSKKTSSSSENEQEEIEVNIDTMKNDEEHIKFIFKKPTSSLSSSTHLLVGPEPPKVKPKKVKPEDFGRALMPGEGAAMNKYVVDGKRIPRRGEIALTSEEISKFEEVGYVMSGSRNRRMEAIRLRKENQIFSAHDKRTLARFNHDVKSKKEAQLLGQFRELIRSKQKNREFSHN
jgi:hypothetical protein